MDAVQFFPDEPQAFRNLFLFHVLNLDRFHLVILLRMTQFKCFTEELSLDLELTVNRWRNLPHIPLFSIFSRLLQASQMPFSHRDHPRLLLRFLSYAAWHQGIPSRNEPYGLSGAIFRA